MNTLLSNTVKVADYQAMEKTHDLAKIADFVHQRFEQRYLLPVEVDPKKKNGFTMMAVSCLMIEALESFYQGWPDTRNKSELAFYKFFDRNQNFAFMRGLAGEFYKHVRCGILHQAETTGGWRIRRDGVTLNRSSKTINATKFVSEVRAALSNYCQELGNSKWEDGIVKNLRKKMTSICRNCEG